MSSSQLDVGDGGVLLEMLTDDVPGISNTLGATESVHASAICAGRAAEFRRLALHGGVAEHGIVGGEGRAEREERDERDAVLDAGVEHRL